MKKLLLATAFISSAAAASSNINENFTHIGFGYKHTRYATEGLAPYFKGNYKNDEWKNLGGFYLDLQADLAYGVYFEGYADATTRFSTSIDQWQAGMGYAPYRSPFLSTPVSCGVINYSSSRDNVKGQSEVAPYCKLGIRTQIANHWNLKVDYQHAFYKEARQSLTFDNVFQFGRVFGLVAGLELAQRHKTEIGYKFGMQFSF
ncbi:hypothetical protein A3K86_19520 [Photobacterium jeanii]|uniref:Outer membrane protein beta-barrel domain-containing protein n=1 Tax=Photobacterium jeanii TaxID=858640 RepID=A0A178K352_9GAMM|nr:hypothetical protein [Photobacterium jeanii]OAN11153.1 hypothetical protein A3K86_19520 [Photobacterium jeanii]PST90672.1 hypothetical protein C9I91_08620 [Photobacterium jeanii]